MSCPAATHAALLLVGPTGSGKTPLGELLEQRGYRKASCIHFDFGDNLRSLVERDRPDAFITREDLDFLRNILRTGALLEDEHFPLAERIFGSFRSRRAVEPDRIVVLNGLPRHVGQARAVEGLFRMIGVIHLRCPAATVLARLRTNVGGDRLGREDDDLESVRRKLDTYSQRTAPLLEHYRARGVGIEAVDITPRTTPLQAWEILDRG